MKKSTDFETSLKTLNMLFILAKYNVSINKYFFYKKNRNDPNSKLFLYALSKHRIISAHLRSLSLSLIHQAGHA